MFDPWFPKNYLLDSNTKIHHLIFAGQDWQIYQLVDEQNLLAVHPTLANKWEKLGLLSLSVWQRLTFGNEEYLFIVSSDKYILRPTFNSVAIAEKTIALSFANALRETRKFIAQIPLDNSIYVEQFSRLLPLTETVDTPDDSLLLGTWLTGGVPVSTTAIRRIQHLTPFLSMPDLKEIAQNAGLSISTPPQTALADKYAKEPKQPVQKCFKLSGAAYLEQFFYENVIDIVLHSEKYKPLGISFPSPIVLYGLPGTGKTYAVDQLATFLDWPIFSIDSNSVGSPYIHQTSKKISEIFEKAFAAAPSIIIIDEMEAYLSNREGAPEHRVEEIGEFLRLIPEASNHKVLVVGMTNLLNQIDPAILRTGRFDHKIEVKMPDTSDIETMLHTALEKLPVETDIRLEEIITSLVGKPRSDVTFIVKEAARLTAFKGKTKISQEELNQALQHNTQLHKKDKRNIGFRP